MQSDRTIEQLRGDCNKHQDTIACLRQECERKTKSLEDSQKDLKERDDIITRLVQCANQHVVNQLMQEYPNYFASHPPRNTYPPFNYGNRR